MLVACADQAGYGDLAGQCLKYHRDCLTALEVISQHAADLLGNTFKDLDIWPRMKVAMSWTLDSLYRWCAFVKCPSGTSQAIVSVQALLVISSTELLELGARYHVNSIGCTINALVKPHDLFGVSFIGVSLPIGQVFGQHSTETTCSFDMSRVIVGFLSWHACCLQVQFPICQLHLLLYSMIC
jgi:hypothetical protein